MKVLELFSGTRSIGIAFEKKGHDVFSVEWDTKFKADLYKDIEFLDIKKDIIDVFGIPDVLWASPDCTSFSIAGISHHRGIGYTPKSVYAKKSDRVNQVLWYIIDELIKINPRLIYFVENPRGFIGKCFGFKMRNDIPSRIVNTVIIE